MQASDQLRFDGKVVIITGAGGGLGREYALLFGQRGAKVVVNDLGGGFKGESASAAQERPADKVVNEIKKAGGVAVANYDSVEFGEKIVKTAVDNFGTVDIVINNAGILRDISFQKMKPIDWDLIMLVHLKGAFTVSRAAWNIMREKGYGRIINTASTSGIYGSFGQANYATAKLGLWGFTQTLAKEGAKKNIKCNAIAPLAYTRMSATVMPEEVLQTLDPAFIAPIVMYLCHDTCQDTGGLYEIGGRFASKLRWQRSEGHMIPKGEFSPESVAKNWENMTSFDTKPPIIPADNSTLMTTVMGLAEKEAEAKEAPGAGAPSKSGLISEQIFNMMGEYLNRGEGKPLIPKVKAVLGFEITKKKGEKPTLIYEIDLKNGQGHVKMRAPQNADAVFTMTDADFEQVCKGTLNPQIAFMKGKMKIKGSMAAASKFTPELFPKPTPENMAKYSGAKM